MESDHELVASFLAHRSEEAFAVIYKRHCPAMYGLAVRLAGVAAGADIVQDAWIRAVRGLIGFNGRSTLRTWLCGIVVNCCRERWRREESHGGEISGAVVESDIDAALDVHAALERLPRGYRSVLVLHDLFGYTHLEIAGMLGIEEGTSKSQLARARAAMCELLRGKSHV